MSKEGLREVLKGRRKGEQGKGRRAKMCVRLRPIKRNIDKDEKGRRGDYKKGHDNKTHTNRIFKESWKLCERNE